MAEPKLPIRTSACGKRINMFIFGAPKAALNPYRHLYMSKKLIPLVTLCLLFACEASTENKAKALVQEDMRTYLQDYNSYDPIAFSKLDSSYTSSNQAEFEANNRLLKTYEQRMEECTSKLKDYLANKITQEESEQYKQLLQQIKDSAKLCMARNSELMQDLAPVFSGYQIQHTFKSQDAGGSKNMHHVVYFLDSNLSRVLSRQEVAGSKAVNR